MLTNTFKSIGNTFTNTFCNVENFFVLISIECLHNNKIQSKLKWESISIIGKNNLKTRNMINSHFLASQFLWFLCYKLFKIWKWKVLVKVLPILFLPIQKKVLAILLPILFQKSIGNTLPIPTKVLPKKYCQYFLPILYNPENM